MSIWDSVYAAAYVKLHFEQWARDTAPPVDDEACEELAEEAACIADLAEAALYRRTGKT